MTKVNCLNPIAKCGLDLFSDNYEIVDSIDNAEAVQELLGEVEPEYNYTLEDMKSVSHFDSWPTSEYDMSGVIKEIGKKCYFVSIGSIIRASMCVASGEFTAAIFPGTVNKNCDIAAAKVIVEEAGGKVTNFFGEDQSLL